MKDHLAATILAEAEAAYKRDGTDASGSPAGVRALVREARRCGDVEAVVVALRAQAWAERRNLSLRAAVRHLDEAADLARRHRLEQRRGEILVTRAAVKSELGRVDEAEADLAAAAAFVPPSHRPELVLQRATLLGNVGRSAESVRLFRTIVDDPQAPVDVRAKAANNLAYEQTLRGRYDEALRYTEQAVQESAVLGEALAARFAQTRAWVTMQAGRLAESLQLFAEAGELYEAAGLPLGEHYVEYADALVQLRLVPEALEAADAAAREFARHHAMLMAADADLQCARLTLLSGQADLARARATRAAARFRRQGRTASVARAMVVALEARARSQRVTPVQLESLQGCAASLQRLGMISDAVDAHLAVGRIAATTGDVAAARKALRTAARLSRRSPVLVRLNGRIAAALAARLDGDPRSVVRAARAGLQDLDRHRGALPSMELRALASGHGAELGALGLRALLPTGSASRVFDWMERTRAAALVTADATAPDAVESELAALRTLHADLDEQRRMSGHEPADLLGRIARTEAAIRRATWSAAATPGEPHATFTARDLRTCLAGETLVEYGVLDGRVAAVVVAARRTWLADLGAVGDVANSVEALLFALRRLTRPSSRASADAARLSASTALSRLRAQLVEPLWIPTDAPLVVVPVGELQRIPWGPLHTAPTTVAPSASVWARTRQAPDPPGERVVLVAGPQLPGAVDEVAALHGVYPQGQVLVPPQSSAAAVSDALRGAGLAHLACHGRVRADNPTFSSLLLSDGPLTVHELGMGGAAPRRIVLAACDSGVQVSYPGDEALGFVSALFARGTAGLVASIVLVPDAGAVPLMRSLHEHVARGAPLGDALFAARATLDLDDPAQYVNWCAFNAYGAG